MTRMTSPFGKYLRFQSGVEKCLAAAPCLGSACGQWITSLSCVKLFYFSDCCYLIFDPCFDKFSEKIQIAKNIENPKNTFLIHLHRF
jgi:hypothetical protein